MESSSKLILNQLQPSYLILASIRLLAVLSVLTQTVAAPTTTLANNATDRLSLLSFKSMLSDPLGALKSWNDTVHYCQWPGVTCSRRHPERVFTLVLANLPLDGHISPFLANLTFLRSLYLPYNNLRGRIPPELFRMPRLRDLYLKSNYLDGEIPASLTNSTRIRQVSFTDNLLTGEIPRDIGFLSQLWVLDLGYNSLTGTIPDSLGNMSSLVGIAMQENSLEGSIPDSLGNLTNLEIIQAFNNSLSGSLPSSFYNISSLQIISFGYNLLSGSLPPSMFNTLPNLQRLLLSVNQFHGAIPVSLSNASMIGDIELSDNNFSGTIPSGLENLQYLWWLEISNNRLEAKEASDWDFLSSLANCSSLQMLDMQNNILGGILPGSIVNLSPSLNTLLMGQNQISGSIPTGLGNLFNLTMLSLNDNNLMGTIPNTVGRLHRLNVLSLAGNNLTGEIPQTISNLTQLSQLELQMNGLNGSITSGFGRLRNLQELDLSQNKLTGDIPRELVMLGSLSIRLNLSSNMLSGRLPAEISNLKNLGALDVSYNRLSGDIPSSLGDCESLEYLYMQGNFFQGSIPPSLSNLRGLQVLDLSRNNLSGEIPGSLRMLRSLQQLNLSFNNLEGEVPGGGVFLNASVVSLVGNKKLCGVDQKLHLPTCDAQTTRKRKHKWHTLKVIIPILGVLLFIIILTMAVLAALHHLKNLRKKSSFQSPIEDPFMKVSYAELLRATDGFSPTNLIGTGSCGSVYKGVLESIEGIVAVKVLNLHRRGASKTFVAECETMRHIRHRNLVKIITSCSSIDFQGNDFKAIVLKYMPNGNLEKWLHPEASQLSELKTLTLIQRLNIGIDVASALDYLHHHGHMPIVHCDLKPSNVLLDEDMCAHVSDFGLARFLYEMDSTSNEASRSMGIRGTIGYVAPEYGMGGQASTPGDVYSYGILLLELFTGKRPTNDRFKDGLSLHKYVEMALPERVLDIVDPSLLSNNIREEEFQCLVSVMNIGLSCSKEDPRERMAMGDATTEIHAVRRMYFSLGIHEDAHKTEP